MDNDQRPYRAVSVDVIGVEYGTQRFTRDGVTIRPPVARWRNNLTVMSQRENLFFAASGDCIAVYQPEFPYQKLKRHPALLIRPELANANAFGYMNISGHRAENHYINHLVVGELGSQEILLLATDSGNIEAYYTAAIQGAIDNIERHGLTERYGSSVGLQPFFKHWVYQSAWGLDIHKEARMIAVSSNIPSRAQPIYSGELTATITVFAFALTAASNDAETDTDDEMECELADSDDDDDDDDESEDDDSNYGNDDAEWTRWNPFRRAGLPERTKNYKVVLKGAHGHDHNIPNVCFVNSSEDPEGTWLLSTDITGIMKLWQIWRGTCLRQWDFSNEENRMGAFVHAAYPGWNVATLDVSTFRPVRTQTEFVGAERAPIHYGYHDRGVSFNLTSIARQIPENSRFHPAHTDFSDNEDDSDDDQIINGGDLDDEALDEEGTPTADMLDQTAAPPLPHLQDDDSGDADMQDIWLPENMVQFFYQEEEDDAGYSPDAEELYDEVEASSTDDGSAALPPANRRISEMRSKVKPFRLPAMPIPEIAMIHCSNTSIRMLGSPKARYPHVFCANVVRQALPEHLLHNHDIAEMQAMERLNMIQKIPELGVLLIATQAGRVAVCSLTRKEDLLGFRVDWVLPTKKQERSGWRPGLCTLIGMAVAPVQGRYEDCPQPGHDDERVVSFEDGIFDGVKTTFDPKIVILSTAPTNKERKSQKTGKLSDVALESKPWESVPRQVPTWQAVQCSMRYRLMLTYTDLSVLTYEISRNVEKCYETR